MSDHSLQNTFSEIQQSLSSSDHVDLDLIGLKIRELSLRFAEMEDRLHLYESEFRRELKAKIDLSGAVAGCSDSSAVTKLSGEELLAARRAVSLQFNRIYCIAPLSRNARKPDSRNSVASHGRATSEFQSNSPRVHAR